MQEFCFEAVPSITVKWGGANKLGEFVEHYYEERKILIVTEFKRMKRAAIVLMRLV